LTTKSQESPQFPYMQVACHLPLESFRRNLQLCFRSHLNQKIAHKVMGPQSHGSLSCGYFVGVPGQNEIWVLVLWPNTFIRGKVVASPKFGLWWVLWVCVCMWFVCASKCSNYALINLLFCLCRFVRVIKLACQFSYSQPKA
jgi:hypothetical protein